MTESPPSVFTNSADLVEFLQLDPLHKHAIASTTSNFPLRVPLAYASRMQAQDWQDPLLKQVYVDVAEQAQVDGFSADPVGDLASMATPGLIHKYHGRALLITTSACAVHCRYCFRRHYPYQEAHSAGNNLAPALDYLRQDTSITEVLLSGGDPLSLNDRKLAALISALDAIPHIARIRIHTRQPVAMPERITPALIQLLSDSATPVVMVLHVNHANELDEHLGKQLLTLKHAGITLLNQAVLLKGVNDDVDTLSTLSERLLACGALPYYLNLLDKVQGSAHFEVSQEKGVALIQALRAQLPGYLVPRLIRETAGEPAKTVIA